MLTGQRVGDAAFDKRTVLRAPHVGSDRLLGHDNEGALLAHFGV